MADARTLQQKLNELYAAGAIEYERDEPVFIGRLVTMLGAVDGNGPEFDPWFHVERESTEAAAPDRWPVTLGLGR